MICISLPSAPSGGLEDRLAGLNISQDGNGRGHSCKVPLRKTPGKKTTIPGLSRDRGSPAVSAARRGIFETAFQRLVPKMVRSSTNW
jgi:hypothetical protein